MDEDSNGRKSVDEMPIEGVEVQIIGPGFSRVLRTNALGNYSLPGIKAGKYLVLPPVVPRYNLKVPHPSGVIEVKHDGKSQIRHDLAYAMECVEIQPVKVRWDTVVVNRAFLTVTIKNVTNLYGPGFVINRAEVFPPNGVSVTPVVLNNMNLAVGSTKTYTFQVTGAVPSSPLTLRFLFHNQDLIRCCLANFSLTLPDADCFQVTRDSAFCNMNGTYSIGLQLQNLMSKAIDRIVLRPKPAGAFTFAKSDFAVGPGGKGFYFNLPLIVQGTGSLSLTRLCFDVTFYRAGDEPICTKEVCIDIPSCSESVQVEGQKTGRTPNYSYENWFGPEKTVAVVSSWSPDKFFSPVENGLPTDYVLTIFNLENYRATASNGTTLPHIGTNWKPGPFAYRNEMAPPEHRWTRDNLGSIFGICLDDEGNIYAAQSSAYNVDLAGTAPMQARWPFEFLHGRIFKIENGTGFITLFNKVSSPSWNQPDATITNKNIPNAVRFRSYSNASTFTSWHEQRYPELGDVTFARINGQGYLYASNLEDGTIYKYSTSGNGQPLSSYRHVDAKDSGTPGFAPLGELIWAVQYHRDRLYYSLWIEDLSRFSGPRNNEVWSVGVDPATGDLLPMTRRCEAVMPIIPFSNTSAALPLLRGPGQAGVVWGTSNPVSDIAFSPEGRMLVAERGMGWDYTWVFCQASADGSNVNSAFTNTFPYHARVLEFDVQAGQWTLRPSNDPNKRVDVRFGVGGRAYVSNYHSNDRNSSGGIDYDFGPGVVQGEAGRRIWTLSDYLLYHPYANSSANGLQGMKVGGDDRFGSIVIDHDGFLVDYSGPNIFGVNFLRKYWDEMGTLGDVEIPLRR